VLGERIKEKVEEGIHIFTKFVKIVEIFSSFFLYIEIEILLSSISLQQLQICRIFFNFFFLVFCEFG
jgi:hypothetical protein